MQKAFASQQVRMIQRRMFSYNYTAAENPKVWMEYSKDGQVAGKVVF